MPTRKIADVPTPRSCSHPEHDPPSMMVFENGLWEHICPACGHRQVFRVSKPTLATGDVRWASSESSAAVRLASSVDRVCQVEHPHWEGPMICGNPLPCAKHGGR